ncbi:MAG: peptidoglycan editing factor PgeF [Deltaproteobacteria bacterium]|nr:peptidoglycan editing factor PgeF [Deltaproteobacteria bacterium]
MIERIKSAGGGCQVCFFGCSGGVSRDQFDSLNMSWHVGDNPLHVAINRQRVKKWMQAEILVSTEQIHQDKVYVVHDDFETDEEVNGFDALITARRNIALMIQQADCQGVLLHDPVTPAIAAIHSGWRGSVLNIIEKTVAIMQQQFATKPANLQAYIGPALGPCCAEFINYRKELPEHFYRFQINGCYFDFWDISKEQLLEAGLDERKINIFRECTSCSENYFSYRRACRTGNGVTGRHCSVIRL